MNREEFEKGLRELTDFAYAQYVAHAKDGRAEKDIWEGVFQALQQALRDLPE